MIVIDTDKPCEACGKDAAIIICDGCEKLLCRKCRKFDMWQYGCGSIDTKVFCEKCAENTWINPYGSMMD